MRTKSFAAAEEKLVVSDSSGPASPKVLTLEQWQALAAQASAAATPQPSPIKGSLFGQFYHEPDEESIIDTVLATLEEKLKQADKAQALSLGIKVSADCNKSVEKVSTTLVDTHFPAYKTGECHPGVKALITKYKIDTAAKLTRTSLAALLRAIASRRVHIVSRDLHL